MKNFIQPGKVVTITAAADLVSGQGLLMGKLFGVVNADTGTGAEGELSLEGVYTLPKVEAQAWSFGALIYWDDATKLCTTTASGNTKIGHALAAVENPSTAGTVRLSGAA